MILNHSSMNMSINAFATTITLRKFSGITSYDATTQEPTDPYTDSSIKGDVQLVSNTRIQNSGGLLNNDSRQITIPCDTTVSVRDWIIYGNTTYRIEQVDEYSNRKIIFVNKLIQ